MRKDFLSPSVPRCYNCGEAPAARLAGLALESFPPFFCSFSCAASAAVADCMVKGLRWCHHRGDWRSYDLPCEMCDAEERAAEDARRAAVAGQAGAGKGVYRD